MNIKNTCPKCNKVRYGEQRFIYICDDCNEERGEWIEMIRSKDDREKPK
jgi:hypothetical protein